MKYPSRLIAETLTRALKETEQETGRVKRRFIRADHIQLIHRRGIREYQIQPGEILTPLARERCRDLSIRIIQ